VSSTPTSRGVIPAERSEAIRRSFEHVQIRE
jgi:hypothetical protein